jgi:multidrug efflux system membrane fusion protein
MTRSRWWGIGALGALVIAGVLWGVHLRTAPRTAGGTGRPADAQPARAIPVAVAAAARRDVPVYLEGLGSVVANRTVTVRPQIDGRLEAVQFREGQPVRRGDVLAQIDPRPFQAQLHQAEGALARDQAQLRNAQLNVTRDRQLVAQNLIAQQQLDTDAAAEGQLEGAVRMDQAAIETAHLNLDYARITSPIDGVTGVRLIDPGNVVRQADPGGIVVVAQLDPIAVLFTLPQDELGPVAEALAAGRPAVDAYSRDGSTLLGTGELALIDNQINQATATIRLKALLPNPRRALWPNQFVNARLHLRTRKGALVVPSLAVQRGPSGTYVYVVGRDETVSLRPITLEATQGDLALVAKGVEEGDRVVVDGQNQLRPGARVVVRGQGKPKEAGPVASDGSERGRAADGAR